MENLYVELHVLQDMPPNCLNRNQDGSPKTALYGGVQRSYVSSQAWKKAIREFFKERINEEKIGYRTLELSTLVERELIEQHGLSEKETAKLIKKLMSSLKLKSDKNDKLKALFAVSKDEIRALANVLINDPGNSEAIKTALREFPSVDACLFGRMAADDNSLNVDAACQIAPAISVNEIQMDTDFFTAVDDVKETSGAGMMGTKEFTSGVLYRYACLSTEALKENYSENIPKLVSEFVKCFIESMPKGMQNGYAANTLPYGVYAVLRKDRPISFISAFEEPVQQDGSGYRTPAAEKMINEVNDVYNDWSSAPISSYTVGKYLSSLASPVRLDELYQKIENFIADEIGES